MTTNRGVLPEGMDRRTTPARPDFAAESLRGVLTAPRYVTPVRLRIVAETTALRGEPSPESGVDTQALFGEWVDVYEFDDEGWAWGQLLRDGYVGFLAANDVMAAVHDATHTVSAPRTLVYPARSIKAPAMHGLPLNARVAVLERDGAFARIEPAGWVWADHLAPLDAGAGDFVAVAERFLNAPYLWGGKTWLGVDCSGLVQISLQAAGVEAQRDTDMQARDLGAPVSVDAGLRRGDLVFWKGHVGIMRDAHTLLHANGASMQVTSEPLAQARARIVAAGAGDVTVVKRL